MPPDCLLVFTAVGGGCVLLLLVVAALKIRYLRSVTAEYPGGIMLSGQTDIFGRVTFNSVQWSAADRARPGPCPLVLHLPRGDLDGRALGNWQATTWAAGLGAPEELEVWPSDLEDGTVVAVSVRMTPGRLFVPPVAVSIDGVRIPLPVSEREAVRVLGEPARRRVFKSGIPVQS